MGTEKQHNKVMFYFYLVVQTLNFLWKCAKFTRITENLSQLGHYQYDFWLVCPNGHSVYVIGLWHHRCLCTELRVTWLMVASSYVAYALPYFLHWCILFNFVYGICMAFEDIFIAVKEFMINVPSVQWVINNSCSID